MKTSSFLTMVLSAAALVAVSMMDWSSMCHPSEEAQATQDQLRHVGEAKLASLDPEPLTAVSEVRGAEGELAELTWQTLSDVEFTDVYLEELTPTTGCQRLVPRSSVRRARSSSSPAT